MTVRRPYPTYRDIRATAGDAPDCARCGVCCEKMGGAVIVGRADVERWLRERRADILKYVDHALDATGGLARFDPQLWMDPAEGPGFHLDRCPHLACTWDEGFRCRIHDTRPFPCRDFEFDGERCRAMFADYVKPVRKQATV